MQQLAVILTDDQKYRLAMDSVQSRYGSNSKNMHDLVMQMDYADSIDLTKVSAILDKYGWLGAEDIGKSGNSTLFLVIQHSDIQAQQKYLPMMRAAVKNGKAQAGELALLEDRVALREGRKQIYGSQVGWNPTKNSYYVLPLDDPDNVDKRRASVALPPLAEYLSRWEIKWNPEQYKRDLPAIEKEWKGR